ncbi:MAG: hydroxylamine oxidoreductase [Nitrospirae bacterium]|nr:hydroxylamine oxidoreductase [Nitrospirota bacterium]MBF0540163.1 hydroxylamine oxidoreductase [Nitrospirota bacterium]
MLKRTLFITLLMFTFLFSAVVFAETKSNLPKELSAESKECIACHSSETNGIYQQWGKSKHYRANVGCYECHEAQKGDADAFEHNGHLISVIVSPKDCAKCHAREVDEFVNSHHSKAGRIMGSLDNVLADLAEGNRGFKTEAFPNGVSAAAVNGCWQCHGTTVKVLKGGKLDPVTWPNTGMGRGNPDGSEGSCSACHYRHEFSVEQVRQPETCGKCHMGPDHPQIEIYKESKHGILFEANRDKLNLSSSKWVVGEDYTAAPTCATCHMSATKDMPVTHNVGLRIKYNNRPPQVTLANNTDLKWGLASGKITGDMRRQNMINVCKACHNINFINGFYTQYEGELQLYSEKFAIPGEALNNKATEVLKAVNGPAYAQFSQKIDYTWFEIWHHEGRRARHGASMMAPDYTQWHGNYEVAKHWYGEYIPELREVVEIGKKHGGDAAKKAAELDKLINDTLNSPNHQWSLGKEDPSAHADRMKFKKEYEDRYKK